MIFSGMAVLSQTCVVQALADDERVKYTFSTASLGERQPGSKTKGDAAVPGFSARETSPENRGGTTGGAEVVRMNSVCC